MWRSNARSTNWRPRICHSVEAEPRVCIFPQHGRSGGYDDKTFAAVGGGVLLVIACRVGTSTSADEIHEEYAWPDVVSL